MTNIDGINKEILNSISDNVLLIDRDYKIVFANKAMLQLYGQRQEDISNQKCHDFSHNNYLPCYKEDTSLVCPHNDVFKTGKPISVTHSHTLPDGTEIIFDITASPIRDEKGDVIQIIEVLKDVTEIEKINNTLKKSIMDLEMIFNNSPFSISYIDTDMRVVRISSAMEKTFGLKSDEIKGKHCYDVWGQYSKDESRKGKERICDDCGAKKSLEDGQKYTYVRGKGEKFYEIISVPVMDEKGDIVGSMEIGADITERKQMEKVLKEHDVFLSTILNAIGNGIVVIDSDFKIMSANSAYLKQTGLDKITGKHCHEVSHHSMKPCYLTGEECSVNDVFKTGTSHMVVHKHFDKDNNPVFVETIAYPIKDNHGNIKSAVEIITDVTENHILQQQLEKRVNELEEFYDMAVGRELMMIELKEEIEKLKKELEKYKT